MSGSSVRRVTLQTIADRVGVSRVTVSNAFNRPDQLSADLRARILATAEDLRYPGPDPLARSLRSGRVGVAGVLLTGSLRHALNDAYASELLVGVSDAVTQAGTAPLLILLPPDRDLPTVREAVVDGFVGLALPDDHPAVATVRRRGLPFVTVDSPHLPDAPFVGIDDAAAGADLAAHVLAHGHRRIAVLSIPLGPEGRSGPVDEARMRAATYSLTHRRLTGVLDTLAARGLSGEDVQVIETGPDHDTDVRSAMERLVAGRPPPTAVIALADRVALSAVSWATRRGLDVPGDLSVVGFDDIPDAATAGLTTIRQPAREKAALATRMLADPVPPLVSYLPHQLVVRGSVTRPADGGGARPD